jgi:parvulin-like peptidyl-prolyl isomerase
MRWHIWALAALAGVAAAAGTAGAQTDPKTVVATANGHSVTLGEVDAVISARPQPANTSEAEMKQLRYEAACVLVDGLLWEQYLQKNGPKIDKAEVNKRFAELEGAVKKAGKSMADYYKDTDQTEATVRAGIVSILQWDAIARAKINEAQLKRYYEENRDYFDRVTVHARHIVFRVPASAPDSERQEAREKLLAIRAHLVAGTLDFAEAAKRYSQDTTAEQGGDLGTFPRKFVMPESIARVAFALPVNAVSDVVQSEYGLHLITVVERKGPEAGRAAGFESVKDEVRERCADELRLAVMQQLRQAAKIQFNLPR